MVWSSRQMEGPECVGERCELKVLQEQMPEPVVEHLVGLPLWGVLVEPLSLALTPT